MTMPIYEPRGPSPAVVWTLVMMLIVVIVMMFSIIGVIAHAEGAGRSVTEYSILATLICVVGAATLLGLLIVHDSGAPKR